MYNQQSKQLNARKNENSEKKKWWSSSVRLPHLKISQGLFRHDHLQMESETLQM